VFCLVSSALAAEPIETGFVGVKPGPNDKCAVCGMLPNKHPKWCAGFTFQDGTRCFHCCPKCMLHNLHHVSKYQPGHKREDIKDIWVTEYYSTKQINAKDALFVIGTDLQGPMGLDLIPVKGKEAAENLMRDYHGKQVLPLDQVTDELVNTVRRGKK
jgi:nitrous oxide reductase accessory protein NosL